jgi:hypothetical protein
MLVPIEIIERASRLGLAPPTVADWLAREPRTIEDFCAVSPAWGLAWFGVPGWSHHVSNQMIDQMAMKMPGEALRNCADRLSDGQFAQCCQKAGEVALRFCKRRMSPRLLAECVERHPEVALRYVGELLTPGQFAAAYRAAPETAREFCPDRCAALT